MLKYRLFFGTLMTVSFTAIAIFDGLLDAHMPTSVASDKPVQGTLLCILIVVLIIIGQLEFSKLAASKNLRMFTPVAVIGSVLFATSWYWQQLIQIPPLIYLSFLSVFVLSGLLLYQYFRYGTSGVIANCGTNYFSIIYLGLLSSFMLAIRIKIGLWPMLMFVFVIKSADIGAYAIGTLFGKHEFSPKISPGKTWEGMAGAIITAIIASVIFARSCGIMDWWLAAIFGFCFAFIGQAGDLVESMIKRDAEHKDSANKVPGFGGILDIIDSPLVAAPFAYLFFSLAAA